VWWVVFRKLFLVKETDVMQAAQGYAVIDQIDIQRYAISYMHKLKGASPHQLAGSSEKHNADVYFGNLHAIVGTRPLNGFKYNYVI
jgi:hypothetical protein